MRNHLRRYAIGALAAGAVAGAAAFALPGSTPAWEPVEYGLSASPAQLLPANVSTAHPVRIVSTALDSAGRPVVTAETATDKDTAAKLIKQGQNAEGAIGVGLDHEARALEVPSGTDPYRGQQWDFSKIRVADAWQRSTGAGVTVAVIDTGVEATHPDLVGQVLPGKDFVNDTEGASTDPNGHGTHVAGTIAALTGNGTGVSAVAPGAKILPVRVLGANGSGWTSDIAGGIVYAADHGANVINMSLGGPGQDSAMSNAIAYARSKGVTVVAAAGNSRESGSPVSYPAADTGVIAVAATDSADTVAYYSNQGSYVDVAAPGSAIISTVPVAKGSYASYYGTSMASPHVAAVAALVEAYNPALTPDGVEQALETSAVDLGAPGKDIDYGYGRIDAVAALNAAAPTTTTPTTAPTTTTPTTTAPTTTAPTVSPTPSRTVSPTPTKTVTPTPSKTTKPAPKVRPVIRATASPGLVVYGSNVTVTYTVTVGGKPFAGQSVRIGVATPPGAFAYTDASTDPAGKVVFTRAATGRMQVRLVATATGTTLEAASPVSTFTVKTQVAVTSPATGTLKVTLTGATGQNVQIQRLERNRWVLATRYVASTPEFTLTGLPSGTRCRVIVPATTTVTGVTSPTVEIA